MWVVVRERREREREGLQPVVRVWAVNPNTGNNYG